MEAKFKIGDKVIITTLDSQFCIKTMNGVIGHVGVVTDYYLSVDKEHYWYCLSPTCIGKCWPDDCLELVEPEYPSVEELKQNSNIEFV